MAENQVDAAPAKASRLKGMLLTVAIAAVLAGTLVAGLFLGGLLPSKAPAGATEAHAAKTSASDDGAHAPAKQGDSEAPDGHGEGEAFYVALEPAFTVNLQGGKSSRFLQTNVEVVTRDREMADAVSKHMPLIRNALVLLLSSKEAEELDSRAGKENLRSEALAAIQDVLEQEIGSKGVDEVFFTSFVMQ